MTEGKLEDMCVSPQAMLSMRSGHMNIKVRKADKKRKKRKGVRALPPFRSYILLSISPLAVASDPTHAASLPVTMMWYWCLRRLTVRVHTWVGVLKVTPEAAVGLLAGLRTVTWMQSHDVLSQQESETWTKSKAP